MTTLVGAILLGGQSTRMGEPKALIDADGQALAHRVAAALVAGGCTHLELIGDDATIARGLDLSDLVSGWGSRSDLWSGIGPLGGLATAVSATAADDDVVIVVAACDQPDLGDDLVRRLVDALDAAPAEVAAAAVVTPDGRRQPFPSAWRAGAGPALTALIAQGARRAGAAFDAVGVVDVEAAAEVVRDLDTPGDLARWREGRGPHLPGIEPADP